MQLAKGLETSEERDIDAKAGGFGSMNFVDLSISFPLFSLIYGMTSFVCSSIRLSSPLIGSTRSCD